MISIIGHGILLNEYQMLGLIYGREDAGVLNAIFRFLPNLSQLSLKPKGLILQP
jgi:hypothetical protein